MVKYIIIGVAVLAGITGAIMIGIYAAEYYNTYFETLLYVSFAMVALTILSGYIDYKKKTKLFYIVTPITVILLISVLTSKLAKTKDFSENQVIAREMIQDLDAFKSEEGMYPTDILEATANFNTSVFTYECSEDGSFFTLKYSVDGWHFKQYDSRTGEWKVIN